MPDSRQPVGARLGGRGQHAGQRFASLRRRRGDPLQDEPVEGVVEGLQDAHPPRRRRGEFGLQLEQHLQVERQLEDVGLHDGQVGAAERVQRFARRREDVALVGGAEARLAEHHRVGRRLDEQLDVLAAGRGVRDRHPVVARVDRLHRLPAGAVDEPLGLEAGLDRVEARVDERLDAASGPGLRHGAAQPEPGRPPRRPPRRPDGEGGVVAGHALGGRHGFAGQWGRGERQRDGLGVDGGADPLVQDAAGAVDGERGVVVHGFHPWSRPRSASARCPPVATSGREPDRGGTAPGPPAVVADGPG